MTNLREICKKVAVILDLLPSFYYTGSKWGEKRDMLSLEDGKTLVSAYKYIERTCEAIDKFIFNHAISYGPDPALHSTFDVLTNIVDLMERKIKLINLKLTIDETIKELSTVNKQILILKMRFRVSVKNIQEILKLPSERTTFRRIDHALAEFVFHLNENRKREEVEDLLKSENWIANIKKSYEKQVALNA